MALVITSTGDSSALRGWLRTAVLAVPPLLLAAAGVAQPSELTVASAHHWLVLHVVLVPVFPLLAVAVWVLLAGDSGVLAWLARGSAFVYAALYGASDAVNGVATGVLVAAAPVGGAVEASSTLRPVLRLGDHLAWIGSSASWRLCCSPWPCSCGARAGIRGSARSWPSLPRHPSSTRTSPGRAAW